MTLCKWGFAVGGSAGAGRFTGGSIRERPQGTDKAGGVLRKKRAARPIPRRPYSSSSYVGCQLVVRSAGPG